MFDGPSSRIKRVYRCGLLYPLLTLPILGLLACDPDEPPNRVPTRPTVTIAPVVPTTADDLVATAEGSMDPEGTGVITYSYVWYEDDVLSETSTSETFPASATTRGSIYRVIVTPNDGIDDGLGAQVEVEVANSAPSLVSAWLEPEAVRTDDTLLCATGETADVDSFADHPNLGGQLVR